MELQVGYLNVSVICDIDGNFKFKYNPGSIYGWMSLSMDCVILAFIV